MTLSVVAASSYLHAMAGGATLPSLDADLKRLCRERPRRVDRFIELALLGSARCAAGHALRPDCGVYLGSGFGPIASNIASQVSMFVEKDPPKPFDFMNTLGASSGFHVAKNLGLSGQNLFVARRGACLEAALALAEADFTLGVVSQALVGVVEEVTLPLDQHRLRRGLAPDTPVAEGSHWLLLDKSGGTGKSLRMLRFEEIAGLEAWLKDHYSAGDSTYWTLDEDPSALAPWSQQQSNAGVSHGIHGNQQAAWVAEFVAQRRPGSLFLIGGGPSPGRGYTLLHLGP